MPSGFGNTTYTTIGPRPADYVGAKPKPAKDDSRYFKDDEGTEDLDSRVQWAREAVDTLKSEKEPVAKEMRRNMEMYLGKQWDISRRPSWKSAYALNYCFYTAEQWACILADNRPKATFSAYKLSDQPEADILSAAWEDAYLRNDWQNAIELSIKLARIEKKSFLRLTYDPMARGGQGDPRLDVVSGEQVYVNAEATNVENATLLFYEYVESVGTVLARWPHLRGKVDRDMAEGDNDDAADDHAQQLIPPSVITPVLEGSMRPGGTGETTGSTILQAPYTADGAPPRDQTTGGVSVWEFWMRPRTEVTVDSICWTAGNEPATNTKLIEFEDGSQEPLQTVVTEGNIVYELPMSSAIMLQAAQDQWGGIKVTGVEDAQEVVKRPKRVQLYPHGRRLVVVGDYVADDGGNPFAHGEWPFIAVDAYRNPRKFFGLSDIDQIADLQDFLNRLYSLFLDAAILTSNPIWRLPLDSDTPDEDITNAPGAIIRENQMSLKLGKREPGPDMPSYLWQLLNFTIQQIREISGLTETATGGKFKGQQSSETVSMYQEAAGVRFRQGIRNVEQAIVKLGHQFLGVVSQFYTEPRMLKIRDASGVEKPISFTGSEISAPMRMIAKAGSMLPQSPSAKLNMMFQLMSTPYGDFPEFARLLQEVGQIESATALEKRMEGYVKTFMQGGGNPALLWKAPGLIPVLMGTPSGKQKKPKGPGKGGARKGNATR